MIRSAMQNLTIYGKMLTFYAGLGLGLGLGLGFSLSLGLGVDQKLRLLKPKFGRK